MSIDHFPIGEVLEKVEREKFRPEASTVYQYVEIEDVRYGSYDFKEMRGWELPGRAKLKADLKDIFIAHVWGCAGKWFIVPYEAQDGMVVTNGCTRFRIKPTRSELLVDLVAGLCSEIFAVQMRALATGSDGLAQVATEDILHIVLPKMTAGGERDRLSVLVEDLIGGRVNFGHAVRSASSADWPQPSPRKNHCALV